MAKQRLDSKSRAANVWIEIGAHFVCNLYSSPVVCTMHMSHQERDKIVPELALPLFWLRRPSHQLRRNINKQQRPAGLKWPQP